MFPPYLATNHPGTMAYGRTVGDTFLVGAATAEQDSIVDRIVAWTEDEVANLSETQLVRFLTRVLVEPDDTIFWSDVRKVGTLSRSFLVRTLLFRESIVDGLADKVVRHTLDGGPMASPTQIRFWLPMLQMIVGRLNGRDDVPDDYLAEWNDEYTFARLWNKDMASSPRTTSVALDLTRRRLERARKLALTVKSTDGRKRYRVSGNPFPLWQDLVHDTAFAMSILHFDREVAYVLVRRDNTYVLHLATGDQIVFEADTPLTKVFDTAADALEVYLQPDSE